jgi:hypothetical protein
VGVIEWLFLYLEKDVQRHGREQAETLFFFLEALP